jgi:hypothetical protein
LDRLLLRHRRNQPENVTRALVPLSGCFAFVWSIVVLTTGVFGALKW